MMSKSTLKNMLRNLSSEERQALLLGLSDDAFVQLLCKSDQEIMTKLMKSPFFLQSTGDSSRTKSAPRKQRWFEKEMCGLSKSGAAHLRELCRQLQDPYARQHVDRKQVRYMKQLRDMRLSVPDIFRTGMDPKSLYQQLSAFCIQHDIPAEIVNRVLPSLIEYIETGHFRPIIFVGEKGCGKTTAVRMLVEQALQLPTVVIKIPQTDGAHGMTGDCGSYQSADAGCLAKARLDTNSLLVAYVFDEIDKVTHGRNRASVDDELLSVTDESCSDVYDNYLETTLVGLNYCPMFMTANDLQKVSPILADRCSIVHFPNASSTRIKSISRKYTQKKLSSSIYQLIRFDYDLMDTHIDNLVHRGVTSLRKHQQMIEVVLQKALDTALVQESDNIIPITEEMFAAAEHTVLNSVRRRAGFAQ